ncbi:hypothetical protein, partial [Turicimonas muris]
QRANAGKSTALIEPWEPYVIFSPLYGDLLMKRPLRNRTVGAVRGGRGNPTLYSIVIKEAANI